MTPESRCWWCGESPEYIAYHDTEWGFPVTDDRRLFEKICLEGFQSGLSWLTILRKREGFRQAFENFEIERVSRFTARDVERLLKNESIVRHRGKIGSVVNNAKRAIELADECGSIASYVWRYEPAAGSRPALLSKEVLCNMTTTPESTAMSKDLKKRGWNFVGPTTVYAFMQAMGLVNDHVSNCPTRTKVEKVRRLQLQQRDISR
jgi:DNA-3-methyladenine glycosylase I